MSSKLGLGGLTSLLIAALLLCVPASALAKPPKHCPKNNSKEFFANPVVDRDGKRVPAPTGVRSPAICSFESMRAALSAAGKKGTGSAAIATGAKGSKKATFKKEPELDVPAGVVLTTTDDPAQGGSGLNPARYVLHYAGPRSGNAVTLGDGAEIRGVTVDNPKGIKGRDMLSCEDGSAAARAVIFGGGTPKGSFGNGIRTLGECSADLEAVDVSHISGAAAHFDAHSDALTLVTDSSFTDSGSGMVIHLGDVVATGSDFSGNDGEGILIDGAHDVSLHDFSSDDNGGVGLWVKRAVNGVVLADGERPTLASLSTVTGNGGDGVLVGDADTQSDFETTLTSVDLSGNGGAGIHLLNEGSNVHVVRLLDNDVFTNSGNGLRIEPVTIPANTPGSPSFAQNKFHNNSLNQIVFDGGGGAGFAFTLDSPTGMCDFGANAVYDYEAKQVFGIFAQGNATVAVHHTQFQGGGTGLKDWGTQAGSFVTVDQNCAAIP